MKQLKIIEPIKGFKYLFGEELRSIKKVQKLSENILVKRGFSEIITPILVNYSLIVGNENRPVSTSKSGIIFDFKSSGGEHLALRYENTFPVCKFYVENLSDQKNKVQKLFYVSPQFRNEAKTNINSRLRQFYQIGWEIIGGIKKTYIVDSIAVGDEILEKLKIKHLVRISEVNIIGEIVENFKITRDQRHTLLLSIDEKNLEWLSKFFKDANFKDFQKELVMKIMTLSGSPDIVLEAIKPLLIKNRNIKTLFKLEQLEKIYNSLKRSKCKNVEIDLSLIRSNKFYSGIIFQYYVGDSDHECGGGGEYNRVVKSLGGPDVISSGGAFGFERIMYEYLNRKKNG